MLHPYQIAISVRPQSGGALSKGAILLASADSLLTVDLGNGQTTREWPQIEKTSLSAERAKNGDDLDEEKPSPKKKQKLNNRNASSRIILATLSPNNKYCVIVTEQKGVHVLAVEENGSFTDLNQRTMPKRPCAIQVLPDNETILLGDKFGDVYSLPLLVTGDLEQKAESTSTSTQAAKTFKPAASHLTVHSKRNRDALEAQLKQQKFTPPTKESPKFQQELLLGHVSMLTDLTFASQSDKARHNYIITTDRDEHIRISRAPPQAHIVEGYCLGHTEYISKISCVPGTDFLLSGGGDTWVGVWHWPSFKLVRQLDMQAALRSIDVSSDVAGSVNVSAIRPVTVIDANDTGVQNFIVITCERIPALFIISADDIDNESIQVKAHSLPAVPLDLIAIEKSIVVSLDVRSDEASRLIACRPRRQANGQVQLEPDVELEQTLVSANKFETPLISENVTSLDDFLFGVSNLRKRRHNDDGESATADGADEGDV